MFLRTLVVVVACLVPVKAEAKCGRPIWIGSPTDRVVPRRGAIYIHVERQDWDREPVALSWSWLGSPGEATLTPISKHVMRLDYEALQATSLSIKTDDDEDRTLRFGEPKMPTMAPRITNIRHSEGKWTCSSYDSVQFAIDRPVAAFRLRWTFLGHTTEWIEAGRNGVEIGKRNCGGTDVEPAQFHLGGKLELFAIDFDGTEFRVEGMPNEIRFPRQHTSDDDNTLVYLIGLSVLALLVAIPCGLRPASSS